MLDNHLGSRISMPSCVSLVSSLASTRFTRIYFQPAELGLSRDINVMFLRSVLLRSLVATVNGSVTSVKLHAAVRSRTGTFSFATESESCH